MQSSNTWLATAFVHKSVRNSAGEIIGTIEDIVVNPVSGVIEYAIVSLDELLGRRNRLFAIPWSSLRLSSSSDYVLLDVDRERLERAPGFEREHWPDLADPAWRRSIHEYYGVPVSSGRTSYVAQTIRPPRRRMSIGAGIALVILILALGWMAFLVSTRGLEQAKQDVKSSMQTAAYAAKETTRDAALTTKVKTALALSKRTASEKINVDSQGDVVTLSGQVPSSQVSEAAESVARDVSGVRDVQNQLVTGPQTQ
jgi:osmotically-inducible protein OsmY/sporulation protein YlmC with PRC-barrel domain